MKLLRTLVAWMVLAGFAIIALVITFGVLPVVDWAADVVEDRRGCRLVMTRESHPRALQWFLPRVSGRQGCGTGLMHTQSKRGAPQRRRAPLDQFRREASRHSSGA